MKTMRMHAVLLLKIYHITRCENYRAANISKIKKQSIIHTLKGEKGDFK